MPETGTVITKPVLRSITADPQNLHQTKAPLLCRGCAARVAGICSVLDPQQLIELAIQTRKTRHDAGSLLIGEGASTNAYANLMRGVVKMSKVTEDGNQQLVGLQFAPDFLGRLFGDESTVTLEAASDLHLCVIPRGALERILTKNTTLERRLMQQTLRELDDARDWMVTLGRKSARQKVASLLHLFASHAVVSPGSPNELHFDLPLTRADIGDFLGLTFETVSRQFSRLRTDGVISVTGSRHVKVPDLAVLHQMCG